MGRWELEHRQEGCKRLQRGSAFLESVERIPEPARPDPHLMLSRKALESMRNSRSSIFGFITKQTGTS